MRLRRIKWKAVASQYDKLEVHGLVSYRVINGGVYTKLKSGAETWEIIWP